MFSFPELSYQVNDLLMVYEAYLETKTVHSMMTALACPVPEAPDGGWKKAAAFPMAHATGSLLGHEWLLLPKITCFKPLPFEKGQGHFREHGFCLVFFVYGMFMALLRCLFPCQDASALRRWKTLAGRFGRLRCENQQGLMGPGLAVEMVMVTEF